MRIRKNPYLILIIFNFLFITHVRAQYMYVFDPVVVTASRLQSSLAARMREVIVLDRKDINQLPAQTVQSLLHYSGSVDVQNRGDNGVQADFSLRGSSFEQVLVLVDGVRINDPQTGHHNSDIPSAMTVPRHNNLDNFR